MGSVKLWPFRPGHFLRESSARLRAAMMVARMAPVLARAWRRLGLLYGFGRWLDRAGSHWDRIRAALGLAFHPTEALAPAPAATANPILAAATPLIALMIRLRTASPPANPDGLRHRIVAALRRFQSAARAGGVTPDAMRASHFILCAAFDDIIGNTDWGSRANWPERSLIRTFHKTLEPGPSLATLLNHIQAEPARHIDELELVYVCMSLGFVGRYRRGPDGAEEFQRLREEMYRTILSERGPDGDELSPCWRGETPPPIPLPARVPPWVAISSAAAVLTTFYVAMAFSLGGAADRVYQRMTALIPDRPALIAHREPPAGAVRVDTVSPSTPSPRVRRLQGALAPEIGTGQVEVLTVHDTDLIRIWGQPAFVRSGDALSRAGHQLVERVAGLIDGDPGRVMVVGHTDSQFVQNVRFPSALALTEARARAVARVLVAHVGAPDRIDIEGRADTEPVAPNTDAAGRERNRRVDILLASPETRR